MSLNRRRFLELCSISGLAGLLPTLQAQPVTAGESVVSVVDFGADPTGKRDSMGAVRMAIQHLKTDGAVLDFPKGAYRFAPDGKTAMTFQSLNRLLIRGNGSLFIFDEDTRPFVADSCNGITLEDFSIDWATLPFSQGTIVETGLKTFVIELDPGFEMTQKRPINAIGSYDRATRWPMANGMDSYKSVADTEILSPRRLRVNLKNATTIATGTTLVLRHNVYGVTGFSFNRSSKIVLSNISIYSMPGMGLLGAKCTDIQLHRYRTIIKPGSNRLLSTCADSVHISGCDGKIDITECSFQGMGDDAINICSSYYVINKMLGPRSVSIQHRAKTGLSLWVLPQASESVEICDRKTQKVLCIAKVVSVSLLSGSEPCAQLVLDRDLPDTVVIGNIVGSDQSNTHTTIRNCSFIGNRARGVLIHKNAEITGNTFAGCSLAAILLAADTTWMEGPTVRDVTITKNNFSNCYYAHPHDRRGTITIDTAHDRNEQLTPPEIVYQNVTVAENTFLLSPGAAIYCAGLNNLTIKGNELGRANTLREPTTLEGVIVLRNVSQARIQGNHSPVPAHIRLIDCPTAILNEHNTHLSVVEGTSTP